MENVASGIRLPSIVIATTALLAAGLTPAAAPPEITHALTTVSAEVALAGNAVIDNFDTLAGLATVDLSSIVEEFAVPGTAEAFDFPGAAVDVPGAADAFDLVGLFNAEVAAAVGLFNRFISLPFTLYNDFTNLAESLINLDFGMAFSQAVTIPLDIVNYVLGLPGAVVNTAFNMLFVIPGEYLFNFG
ncbi:hypothetical protein BST33_13630 [Mycolicibacter minnesotensis]|uniref:Uncharacterized protein n=1 Tax=Mycolicibacter minnesotensis TaxID=1118379 RepID=A0A7I7R6V0_9MYCO|nr:hypothetical protein [Mycolicibacter minnesotensis]ORA99516.1 hypothetical protein BST33_13630 [Mycolicibacter minnesotensis]BBY34351.1 hypothetical protein MMIN_24120 [Mycolicibacter minnesotensis]